LTVVVTDGTTSSNSYTNVKGVENGYLVDVVKFDADINGDPFDK